MKKIIFGFLTGTAFGFILSSLLYSKEMESMQMEIDTLYPCTSDTTNEDVSEKRNNTILVISSSDPVDVEHPEDDEPDSPYIISEDQYSEDRETYKKLTLFYYSQDDILTDDGDNIIDDVSERVGDDALNSFGKDTAVFVRNPRRSEDYEIIKLNKCYSSDVLGYAEKNEKRRRRKDE